MTARGASLISALRRIDGQSAVEGIGPDADAMMIDGATVRALGDEPPTQIR